MQSVHFLLQLEKKMEEERTGKKVCVCLSAGMQGAGKGEKDSRATGSWCLVMHVPWSLSVCVRPLDLRCPAGVCLYITGGRNVLYTHARTHTQSGKSSSTAFLTGLAEGGRREDKEVVCKRR